MNIKELRRHFYKGKARPYVWPGGYPVYFLCFDGGVLCPDCVTKNRANIFRSTGEGTRDGWRIEAVEVNWEDNELTCDNCNKRIESAYGEATTND